MIYFLSMKIVFWHIVLVSAGFGMGKGIEFNHERTVLSKIYDCDDASCPTENEKYLRGK